MCVCALHMGVCVCACACVCVFKRAWSVAEVEDYSPDFHMYWEAIRCVCACMCVAHVCVSVRGAWPRLKTTHLTSTCTGRPSGVCVCVYVCCTCVCVCKRGWSVAEVEDYSPDFHMYWEVIKCVLKCAYVCLRLRMCAEVLTCACVC